MRSWLWRWHERRLRRRLPPDRAATVAGDLLEDFERRAGRDGRLRAEWWLLREVRSIARSYGQGSHDRRAAGASAPTSRMNGLPFDLRLAVRSLGRQPGLATVIVTTVGLAVAVNTALFSIFDGLLVRPLPYRDADRIVFVETPRDVSLAMTNDERRTRSDALRATPLFADRAYALGAVLFEDGAEGVEEWGIRPASVTPGLLPLLGVRPLHGRLLTEDDVGPPFDGRSTLLGFDLWRSRFGGDPDVVGRSIDLPGTIFGRRFRVVGVLPRGVSFPAAAGLWVARDDQAGGPFNVARLADSVSVEQVRRAFPGTEVTLLRDQVRPEGAFALGVLLAATGLLLLVAWVQVAALLFARTAGRGRELGVRLALGAGRGRLVRQFAAEGVVVAAAALALAWLVTPALTSAIVALLPAGLTDGQWLEPDGRALVFSAGLSLLGVVVLSLAPAGVIRGSAPAGLLRAGAFTSVTRSAARTRLALLATQLAVTTTLLYMAGLSLSSFGAIGKVDLGFVPDRVVAVQLPPTSPIGSNAAEIRAHLDRQIAQWGQSVEAISSIPGVEAVGQGPLPFYDTVLASGLSQALTVPGSDVMIPVRSMGISPAYVDVMGLQLLEGRIPTTEELSEANDGLVNATLAARLAVSGPVVGSTIRVNEDTRIVGVVADFFVDRPDRPAEPMLIRLQTRRPMATFIQARLAEDAPLAATLDAIRAAMDRVWPDNPSREVMLVSDLADRAIADYRARAVLLGLIGASCLPLALAGIAGALSYATSQRVREIGIRMALGAEPADIRRRVLGRAFTAVSLGLVVGLGGGMLMGGLMSSYLFGVRPIDGWTIVGATVVLTLTAWSASILPARRALRIEPAQALREA